MTCSFLQHRLTTATALALALALSLLLGPAVASAGPELGKPAPGFTLRDGEGTLFRLAELAYPGRARAHQPKHTLLLDFFRTDCKPCRKSLAKLVQLHKRYQAKGLKIVLVALLEEQQGREKLDAFLRKRRLPFTVLIDAYGVAGKKYVKKGNGFSIPASFIVDRDGVLRQRFGMIDDKAARSLSATLSKLLP